MAPHLLLCVQINTLKTTADKYEEQFKEDVADFVRNKFYVDDGLQSVKTPEQAVRLVQKISELCKAGGFHLHKFICNDKTVVEKIPEEARAKNIQQIDLKRDALILLDEVPPVRDEDPEVKKSMTHSITMQVQVPGYADLPTRLVYFSDWHRARRSVALCRRYVMVLKNRTLKQKMPVGQVTVNNIHESEKII